nr:hypothetical protein [Tanacetum cinerariifolium]
MNYLEEQTDDEAMINSIQNGDQPLPVIAPVSLAGTAQNASPTLKDLKFWTAEEKKTRKIDRLARSFLIQRLLNDIYSFIDRNETAKDLWDALERQMHGSEYAEQDRKAAILYEYETFKATEGEQLLDTYLRYLQVINDLKKCGYKKDNCELNYKFLNNLQPKWKQYDTLMRQTKNLMDINIDAFYNILKQNQVSKRKEKVKVQTESKGSDDKDINDLKKITALLAKAFNRKKYYAKPINNNLRTSSASFTVNKKPEYVKSVEKKEDKKADKKKRDMSKVKCYDSKKEGHFAKDYKKAKVKDYNYYKTKMLLAKKDINTFEEQNNEFNEQMKVLNEKNADLLAQTEVLQDQLKINFPNDYFQEIINPDFEKIDSSFQQTSSLKPYVSNVILEKIIINLEDEVVSLLEKEKANLETIESLKSKGFESSENAIFETENQSENDCQVLEKECDNVKNPKVIAPGMFKLNVSQSVSPISMSKTSCDSKNVENKTKRKRDLDTFSSFRRPEQSNVIWKEKWSSNTSNVDLSSVSHLKLNKDVKRYSQKDLLSCNNSHLGETSSAYVCNDAMNVSCNSRLFDSFDENNLFIFDYESVRISPVSKMPFRKKPRDCLNVHSKRNSNQSLPRTIHMWLPKMQPLAKWIPGVERQIDKISKTPNS